MRSYRIGFMTIRGGSGILAALIVVGAVVLGVGTKFTRAHLLFTPDVVVSELELWQLVTWLVFPSPSPFAILMDVLIVLSMGSELERGWGTARFWRVVIGIGASTAGLVALASLLIPRIGGVTQTGAHILTMICWVGLGFRYRRSMMQFWNIPVTGYTFALIGLAFSLFNALYGSWLLIVPDLVAAGLTFLVVHEDAPGSWWLRFRSWQLSRDLKKRASHLQSLDGGRNMGRDSDKFLH